MADHKNSFIHSLHADHKNWYLMNCDPCHATLEHLRGWNCINIHRVHLGGLQAERMAVSSSIRVFNMGDGFMRLLQTDRC